MTKETHIDKYLWITLIVFVTYLLLGSFVVSRDFLDIAYLFILYSFIITSKIQVKRK